MGVKKLLSVLAALALTKSVVIGEPVEPVEEPPIVYTVETEEPEQEAETVSRVTEPEPEIVDNYIYYDVPLDLAAQREITDICTEYGISYELILGVVWVESTFKADALGDNGNSFGLMQIQPKWWNKTMEREGVTNLLDPIQNIRCGCAILQELKNRYDTEYEVLQAYNTGRPDIYNGYAERVYQYIGELNIYEE